MDWLADADHRRIRVVGGWALAEASVGTMLVVVHDEVVEEPPELAFVPDQRAVEKFVADGADPSLSEGVRLWCAGRGDDRLSADGDEDVVEGSGVLAGAVADHEPDGLVLPRRRLRAA